MLFIYFLCSIYIYSTVHYTDTFFTVYLEKVHYFYFRNGLASLKVFNLLYVNIAIFLHKRRLIRIYFYFKSKTGNFTIQHLTKNNWKLTLSEATFSNFVDISSENFSKLENDYYLQNYLR